MRSHHRLAITLGALGLLVATIASVPAVASTAMPPRRHGVVKLSSSVSPSGSGSAGAGSSASPSTSASPSASPSAGPSITPPAGPEAETLTKTLTRDYFNADGSGATSTNTVTVNIDRHTSIQDNERIHITWSGAHPTGGRTNNPFGANGMQQEYPVMIMECRGTPETVTPQTCWTDTNEERTISALADPKSDQAVWLDDMANTAAEEQRVSGLTDEQAADIPADDCTYDTTIAAHITPFVATDGHTYYSCDVGDMAPEAAENGSVPANEIAAYTGTDGKGTAEFEIRTAQDNQSLGCSESVACTVEVIPIEGISCTSASEQNCNLTGAYQAGVSNNGTGVDLAVSPQLWWSPSNWANRFGFQVYMAPPPSVCSISDTAGSPVPFYGSELLGQAALQWTPAYCLDSKRFNWQDNVMSDDAAFSQMESGAAAAAEVSDRGAGDTNIGYAATAVTGWGIAFDIDKPDGSQLTSLKLDPRLLAKMLTESYPGGPLGAEHPGLTKNPYSLNMDPEFEKLNPGLNERVYSEAAGTLLALSTSSAAMYQLTSYIASDPAAMAWINGKADQWGMTVNPAYKGISLPVSTWPLLDPWYPKNAGLCLDNNPAPYMQKVAEPVDSLRLISTAMLYDWPNVNTVCTFDASTNTYGIGRVAQQSIGGRFMLGLVDLGDAHRYGLTVASLEAGGDHYVAPTPTSLAAAVKLAKPAGAQMPFTLDESTLTKASTAYPGTMVVYTAAKTKGLDAATAKDVSEFIKISSTEGQKVGRGNGQLPDGYLPIAKSGPTSALYQQAQTVAAAIADQTDTPSSGGNTTDSGGGSTNGGTNPGGSVPPGEGTTVTPAPVVLPAGSGPVGNPPASAEPTTLPLARTAMVSSSMGGGLLPVLLFVGLGAALMAAVARAVLRAKGLKG